MYVMEASVIGQPAKDNRFKVDGRYRTSLSKTLASSASKSVIFLKDLVATSTTSWAHPLALKDGKYLNSKAIRPKLLPFSFVSPEMSNSLMLCVADPSSGSRTFAEKVQSRNLRYSTLCGTAARLPSFMKTASNEARVSCVLYCSSFHAVDQKLDSRICSVLKFRGSAALIKAPRMTNVVRRLQASINLGDGQILRLFAKTHQL